ncbi:cell division protein ZapD [Orbus hercynius]|uniref:Cell division protein ZapD n=1 Tax=Orbus hercynius TaxID=593135 RepID=A0A495RJ65_9GAMM|nr:cell division protein ZapD [Orbus hercynius]RKS86838.1 cell division protein ZapD [Orbus hercynius]
MDKHKVIFEHPLNEKMRTWLRIEFLIKQLEYNKTVNASNALLFFHSLSELLEIVERNDVRGDLNKDIEEQKQKLSTWLNVPGVDTHLLNELLDKLNAILAQLSTQPKMGQSLKEDRFVSSVRKRLTIPGGCCSFDLPSFHLWLQQPQDYRDTQITAWRNSFLTLYQAISIYMQLTRQTGVFKSLACSNNFYQNTNEVTSLLRIRVRLSQGVYPQVSGNATRYAIRFVNFESSIMSKIDASCVEFELASC